MDIAPELIQRASERDAAATRTVIEILHRPIIAMVHYLLSSDSLQRTEAVAQEIFLDLFGRLELFDGDGPMSFQSWVIMVVKDGCLLELNGTRRRHRA